MHHAGVSCGIPSHARGSAPRGCRWHWAQEISGEQNGGSKRRKYENFPTTEREEVEYPLFLFPCTVFTDTNLIASLILRHCQYLHSSASVITITLF